MLLLLFVWWCLLYVALLLYFFSEFGCLGSFWVVVLDLAVVMLFTWFCGALSDCGLPL